MWKQHYKFDFTSRTSPILLTETLLLLKEVSSKSMSVRSIFHIVTVDEKLPLPYQPTLYVKSTVIIILLWGDCALL